MKVLITGPNSYIGKACKDTFEFKGVPSENIAMVSLKDNSWLSVDFSSYDTVIHCAGLVHQDEKKIPLEKYIEINAELAEKVAIKAKNGGVNSFIFFSTKAVYGLGKSCFSEKVTYSDTIPHPKTKYGISKYVGEKKVLRLESEDFHVAILRPPLVYGNGCSGNYQTFRKVVCRIRILPKLKNHLSMIYIENLCELVYQIVDRKLHGVFLPQDLPLKSSTDLGLQIAKNNGIKVCASTFFNPFIAIGSLFVKPLNSAFGGAIYEEKASLVDGINYQIVDFEEGVRRTEQGEIKKS